MPEACAAAVSAPLGRTPVPVVPVAILGSYQVRNWRRLQFPNVTVEFGKPFRFETVHRSTREQQLEAAEYILERIREVHTELSRAGRKGARRAARARLRRPAQAAAER